MLIFDMDGTLWITTDSTLEAADYIASLHHDLKPVLKESIEAGMGLGSEDVAKIYMPYLDLNLSLKYLEEINNYNMKLITDRGATLYDGVIETIRNLSKKYRLAIVTNNNDDYVKSFFKCSGLEDCFVDYMGASSYGISKSEAISRIVKRNCNLKSIYIGDIDKDRLAANEAGVLFIHAKYGFQPDVISDYAINQIDELIPLVDEILGN